MIDNISEDFFKKNEIIKKLWPLPIVFFLVYTPVSFFILKDYFTGWIHLVTLLFFIISLLVYRKIKNVKIINNMLAIIGIPALIPWLITGGPGGVGFWWSLVYITWAFYITTKKSAILLLSTYLVLSIIIVILSQMQIGKIAYTIAELLNLLFAYIITFSLVYLFDNVREYYFQLSNKKSVELAKVNENLTSINTELEQFIYSASHDLQEPLRMVTIYLQLLEKRYKDKLDIDAKEFFEFAMDGSKRMRDLINALIDYSHINTVRTLEDIDLNKLLKNILAELKDQIVENNAIITINPLPSICADKVLISQLFQNLISNAIKFKGKNNPEIIISEKKSNNEYLFSVKDNGIGIQKEYAGKLFTIFQRLNAKEQYPGTGIGLVICKKIVEKYGGKIWFESEFGKGTTFYFTIKEKMQL